MRLSRGIFRKNVFRKHLALFLITILVPTCLFLGVYMYGYANNVKESIVSASNNDMDRVSRNLDIFFENTDRIALQASLNPSIVEMLNRPFEKSAYDFFVVKELLRGWTSYNSLFQSVYIHILQNNKVLTTNEGLYSLNDFYDAAFIHEMDRLGRSRYAVWTGVRRFHESTGVNTVDSDVLTFVRIVPVTEQTPLGVLYINFNKDVFLQTIEHLSPDSLGNIVVIDPQNRLASGPVDGLDAEAVARELQPGQTRTDVLGHGPNKYFITASKSAVNGWTLLNLTPYEAYSGQMSHILLKVSGIFAAVLALGIGLAYLFASILYGPWRRVEERLQGYVLKTFEASKGDVYAVVDHAIHNLIDTIRHNEPVLRDHLVRDLFHYPHPQDDRTLRDRFAEWGVPFEHPYFIVIVISGELRIADRENESRYNLVLYSLAEELLNTRFQAAGSVLGKVQFAFLLNTERSELQEETIHDLEACCQDIVTKAREHLDVSMHFCIGGVRPLHRVHEAYEQARRVMAYKAFLSHSGIFYANEWNEPQQFEYPASYQKLLLNTLMTGNREQAEELISDLFHRYIHNSRYPLPKLQQMLVMLMSHIMSSLAQEGYDIGPLVDEAGLLNLQTSGNSLELQAFISNQLKSVMDYLEAVREQRQISPYIRQALTYIEGKYKENISISDIAAAIGISSGHLSRLFKAEVGKSPLEYLTEYRLEQGKQLLVDSAQSLNQISEAIGYNDVHTFIRFFKKYEGTTPGEYRKQWM
ncbi:helix-turn-helix domain-containing protein [Paenibacillus doosanensis]|uniref:helix-turn-helix domain-containing protein n=1 Tax=Paenibacillus doosanensis TaxID=1229154 RepID=UPI00217FC157|nr:helix-turn-helix domain-containing protein [Paenibacillus doosanensis]MCS7460887.1 helix-turn-helix domain-containing protein [Paenibacillus doosanensis]